MAVQKNEVEKIVGQGNAVDDETTLQAYAHDQSFVPARRPDMVVFVKAVEQIQEVVRLANRTLTPVIPYSSGLNLHGATIPDQGGIILNMSRMSEIIEVDEDNWFVIIEPGVTYFQLQNSLAEKGYRIMVPFGVAPNRSVLSSYLERDPVLAAPSFEHGNYLIMDTEVVLPTGELFRTGNWTSGGRPGSPNGPIRNTVFRLWTGSQGTLGILTKMVIQIEPIPARMQFFFIPFKKLADAIEPLRRIQRKEIGSECFLLNSFNMAALFADSWSTPPAYPAQAKPAPEFDALRQALPPWTMIICINGLARRTEEKIAYETEALRSLCDMLNIELRESLPAVRGAENVMACEMLRPWGILKKFNFRGSVHDLTFKAPMNRIVALERLMHDICQSSGHPAHEIGMYLLPLERGRALHAEFDLHCPAEAGPEQDHVRALWLKASRELLNSGAYFDRPYGPWAAMIYGRATNYAETLRKLKKETDPNNILNPGKLCFA